MLEFLFGMSICLNIVNFSAFLILYKMYSDYKDTKEVLSNEKEYTDFFINNDSGFKL